MVEMFEIKQEWAVFQGERFTILSFDWDTPDSFWMTIEGVGRNEICRFGDGDDATCLDDAELSIRATIFARSIFRLHDTHHRVGIQGQGFFEMDGDSETHAVYETACGQRYRFLLEDLVILAEIV